MHHSAQEIDELLAEEREQEQQLHQLLIEEHEQVICRAGHIDQFVLEEEKQVPQVLVERQAEDFVPPRPAETTSGGPSSAPAASDGMLPVADPSAVSGDALRAALKSLLAGRDLDVLTVRGIREEVALHFGLSRNALDVRRDEITKAAADVINVVCIKKSAAHSVDEDHGQERSAAVKSNFLVTLSHPTGTDQDGAIPLRAPGSSLERRFATPCCKPWRRRTRRSMSPCTSISWSFIWSTTKVEKCIFTSQFSFVAPLDSCL